MRTWNLKVQTHVVQESSVIQEAFWSPRLRFTITLYTTKNVNEDQKLGVYILKQKAQRLVTFREKVVFFL